MSAKVARMGGASGTGRRWYWSRTHRCDVASIGACKHAPYALDRLLSRTHRSQAASQLVARYRAWMAPASSLVGWMVSLTRSRPHPVMPTPADRVIWKAPAIPLAWFRLLLHRKLPQTLLLLMM